MPLRLIKYFLSIGLILTVLSLILSIWQPILHSFQLVFGTVYLLYLPGFVWSRVFWTPEEIEFIERFIFSLVLSLTLMPLVVFTFNKLGVGLNFLNLVLEVLGVIILGLIIIIIKRQLSLKNKINIK